MKDVESKNHYATLKVSMDAPYEVIQAAYKSLAKKYHPDNNSGNAEYTRIMADINFAYSVLSDSSKRNAYDDFLQNKKKETNRNDYKNHFTSSDSKKGFLKQGEVFFYKIPDHIKNGIIDWIESCPSSGGYLTPNEGILSNAIAAFVSTGIFLYCLSIQFEYRWGCIITTSWAIIGIYAGSVASEFLFLSKRRHSTQIKRRIGISPLYIIKFDFDVINYWSILSIDNITIEHENNAFVIKIKIDKEIIKIKTKNQSECNLIVSKIEHFRSMLQNAHDTGNTKYIKNNDIFDGMLPDTPEYIQSKHNDNKMLIYGFVFSLFALFYYISYSGHEFLPIRPTKEQESTNYTNNPDSPRTRISQTTPKEIPNVLDKINSILTTQYARTPSGDPWPSAASYVKGFKILFSSGYSKVTIDNRSGDSDVFAKLYNLDYAPPKFARAFYIPSGGKFTISNISEGKYDVRYRSLKTGRLVKTQSFDLFHVESDDGINYKHISLTLFGVPGGNMRTSEISESEFK